MKSLAISTGASLSAYIDVTRTFNSLDHISKNQRLLGIGCLHFKQFAGGESADELTLFMKKISNRNVGSILALSMEADLDEDDLDDLDDESTLQKTKEMVDSQLDLAQVASTQPDSFIAIKLTAFYPPKILWLMVDSQLDLAQVASTQPDSFIAIKLTAFYPPKILKNWSHRLNLAEEVLVFNDLEHGIPLYQFLKPTCQKK